MVISEKNKVLINRVIDTIDWTLIHKFYKLVGRKIGNEAAQIPGIKKIDRGTKLTDEHIRGEILQVINHVVENDISQYTYGPWDILWVNGEWEMEILDTDEGGKEIENGESTFIPIMESMLEVYFSPMIVVSREIVLTGDEIEEKPETVDLQKQLEKALNDENYELASKLRDLIDVYKKQK
ncbi:MAG: hypothetical protein EBS19_06345 [Spirochaetia bacterium]|nr:hypothetical protein [Spirochaetia bacterium]